jgi:hypothetical protein
MNAKMRRRLLLEVAIHESGHSVIARVLGLKADRATLCDFDGVARSYFEDNVIAVLAGRAASLELLGYASDYGCSCDDATAMRLLTAEGCFTPLLKRELMYARKLRQARKLIRAHWATVERVAQELLARETLSGEEIDRLMPGRRATSNQ